MEKLWAFLTAVALYTPTSSAVIATTYCIYCRLEEKNIKENGIELKENEFLLIVLLKVIRIS